MSPLRMVTAQEMRALVQDGLVPEDEVFASCLREAGITWQEVRDLVPDGLLISWRMRSAQPRSLFRPGEPSQAPVVLGHAHVLVETDSPISILLAINAEWVPHPAFWQSASPECCVFREALRLCRSAAEVACYLRVDERTRLECLRKDREGAEADERSGLRRQQEGYARFRALREAAEAHRAGREARAARSRAEHEEAAAAWTTIDVASLLKETRADRAYRMHLAGMMYTEIGERYGIGRERARQLAKRGRRRAPVRAATLRATFRQFDVRELDMPVTRIRWFQKTLRHLFPPRGRGLLRKLFPHKDDAA